MGTLRDCNIYENLNEGNFYHLSSTRLLGQTAKVSF